MTQSDLAKRLGVSSAYVQKVEAGKANLTLGQLSRIAEALGTVLHIELTPIPTEDTFSGRLLTRS